MSHYLVFKVQHLNMSFRGSFPRMVEMRRIELLTPCLQGRCSPSWATPPFRSVLRSIPFHNFVKAPRHTLSIVFLALPCSEKAALSELPLWAFRFRVLRSFPFHNFVKAFGILCCRLCFTLSWKGCVIRITSLGFPLSRASVVPFP